MKLDQWEDEAKQQWVGSGASEPIQNHRAIVHKAAWLRGPVGAEIPPRPHSLDKFCLCWQHRARGWAGNRMRPVLRG